MSEFEFRPARVPPLRPLCLLPNVAYTCLTRQGLIERKEKEKAGKYGHLFTLIEHVAKNDDCASLILGASKL